MLCFHCKKTTGTGVFSPFLTIMESGTEQGYNSGTQPFDTTRAPQYTHELRLSDLTISTTQDGAQFYSFLIDINESNNPLTSFITLDALKIYTSPGLQPEVTAVANIDSLGTKIFDLDALDRWQARRIVDVTHAQAMGLPPELIASVTAADFAAANSKKNDRT